jgi:hypothetical protein
MKNVAYFVLLAFFLLIMEATVLRSLNALFFNILGLRFLSNYCVNTAFALCIYLALTKSFNVAVFCAFLLGYLSDVFVLSGAWISPLIFAVCSVITNILKRIILLKGTFSFMSYLFAVSILSSLLWMIVTYNLFDNPDAFRIGLFKFFPQALINALFGLILYPAFKFLDRVTDFESYGSGDIVNTRW